MKIIVDPVYTSTPNQCASYVKFVYVISTLLELHDDLFVYWIIPTNMTAEDKAALYTHDRIKFIEINCTNDRFKMYYRMDKELEYLMAFNGEFWDYDFIFTNKSALVSIYRIIGFRPSKFKHTWMRNVILFEDMPIMSFKMSISVADEDTGDRHTILGYLASTRTLISAYWEKELIMSIAKKYFAPSAQRELWITKTCGNNYTQNLLNEWINMLR